MPEFNTIGYLFDPAIGINAPVRVSTDHSLDEFPQDGYLRLEELDDEGRAVSTVYYRCAPTDEAEREIKLARSREREASARVSWSHLLDALASNDVHAIVEADAFTEGVQIRLRIESPPGWHAILDASHDSSHTLPVNRQDPWFRTENHDLYLHVYTGIGGTQHGEEGYTIRLPFRAWEDATDAAAASYLAPLLLTLYHGARQVAETDAVMDQLSRLGE